jgi:HEAT repeat protein
MRRLAVTAILCFVLAGSAHAVARTGALIKQLQTTSGERQIRVIRALGRSGKNKAVPPLLGVFDLRNQSLWQTAAVIEALGRLESRKAMAALIEAWKELQPAGEQVRLLRAALPEALSRIGGDEAKALLLAALDEKDDSVLEAVVRGLGKLEEKSAVDPLVALSRRGGPIGRAAYEALGEIGDKKALPILRTGLQAEKTLDKIPAAYAMARIGDEEGQNLLESFMEPGPEGDKPALLAAYYLVKLNKESGLDFLTMMLGADHNPAQVLAVEALGKAGNPKAILPLAEALQSEEAALRLAVARALGRLGGSRAAYALKQVKNDPNAEVRAAVAAALEELGEEE